MGPPHDRAGDAVGDIDAHAVVDAPARMDDVRVVADFLGLVGDVERIDADAVAADQARLEGQEVPLGAGGLEHVARVDAQPVGDQGDLVDQGDVDVALGVLQHLGELGDADRRGAVGAGRDHALVDGVDDVERLGRVAGDDLQDVVEAALLVAGVDALGRVADVEVGLPFEAGRLLEDGDADVLGDAGIDGGFVDDDVALLEGLAERGRGLPQRLEVGRACSRRSALGR